MVLMTDASEGLGAPPASAEVSQPEPAAAEQPLAADDTQQHLQEPLPQAGTAVAAAPAPPNGNAPPQPSPPPSSAQAEQRAEAAEDGGDAAAPSPKRQRTEAGAAEPAAGAAKAKADHRQLAALSASDSARSGEETDEGELGHAHTRSPRREGACVCLAVPARAVGAAPERSPHRPGSCTACPAEGWVGCPWAALAAAALAAAASTRSPS